MSPQGNDGNDGLSWTTIKLKVSGALAALPAGGIDGSSAQSLTTGYASLAVVCDGSAWPVI